MGVCVCAEAKLKG
jgi:hypothetical protein